MPGCTLCESANVAHISTLNCVDGPSSGNLGIAVDIREAVEARELREGAEDFVEAVEGLVDLAVVLPGIALVNALYTIISVLHNYIFC